MIANEKILNQFQKFNGDKITELTPYINNWFSKYPTGKIAIGTDSIKIKRTIIYATAIALFYPSTNGNGLGKGAHVIYAKNKFKKRLSLWDKLWNEIEYTRIVAEEVISSPYIDINENFELHIDINPDEEYESNKLYKAGTGYFTAMGYIVIAKPDSWVAKCAADSIVNK